eukprot:1755346-Amphidinium_carterae.1
MVFTDYSDHKKTHIGIAHKGLFAKVCLNKYVVFIPKYGALNRDNWHYCAAWQARKGAKLPASALDPLPCVQLHGFIPAPTRTQQLLLVHKPALVARQGIHTLSGWFWCHSSNPHFRHCGVGYYTDTGDSVRLRK